MPGSRGPLAACRVCSTWHRHSGHGRELPRPWPPEGAATSVSAMAASSGPCSDRQLLGLYFSWASSICNYTFSYKSS